MLLQLAGGLIESSNALNIADTGSSQEAQVVPIVLAIFLGAMCGAIVGLIVQRLLRFAVYLAGRHFQGNFVFVIGACAGVAFLLWKVITHGTF